VWHRIIALIKRRQLDQNLDEEIGLHLDMLTEEYLARGLSEKDARERARRDFGGVTQIQETHRELRGMPVVESYIQDFRFGVRGLLKNRGFTLVALLTLAIGIGANTAMFTVLNAILVQPLPLRNPERLMALFSSNESGTQTFFSAPGVYLDWRERSTSFESIEGAAATSMILTGRSRAQQVRVNQVSAGFFDILGTGAIAGRTFSAEEEKLGSATSVLLDEGMWQREFGGEQNVLGQRVNLNDRPFVIIGVVPAGLGFAHLGRADLWIPLEADRRARTGGNVIAVGHLKPGVTREAAQAEMEAVMHGIGREHIEDSKTGVRVMSLHEWMTADVRKMIQILTAAAVFVFFICCANVANLMLARFDARRRELAIRASLGAGRARIARLIATESLLLAAAGGTAGAVLAGFIVRLIPTIQILYIPRASEIVVDWRLFVIAFLTTAGAALGFGILPAWQAVRGEISHVLHSYSSGVRVGKLGTRDLLVVGQFALALMLLTGAGMLMKSLWALLVIDTGFERDRIITVRVTLPYQKYDQARRMEFYRRLGEEIGSIPGVRMVSSADHTPLQAVLFPYDLMAQEGGRKLEALARHVGPEYFDVLGIPVLAGRALEPADDNLSPVPVLVNRKLADALFGDVNPIGKLIKSDYQQVKSLQIAGMVGDARQLRLAEAPGPQIYLPVSRGYPQYVIAKAAPNAGDLTAAIRFAVQRLDPEAPWPEIGSMQETFDSEIAKPRFYTLLLGTFALIGVLLAVVGIYGVTSYAVGRRTHEFGIRMAIGARPIDILALVLLGGARLALGGVLAGLAGAFVITRMLASNLYGAKANDASTIAVVVLLLIIAGLAACFVAGRQATQVNPMIALRCD
jgi:putative ABC transport system permease protein